MQKAIAWCWKHIKNMLTEKDNKTMDISRVGLASGLAVFFGISIYVVAWRGQTWDPQSYGIGISTLLGAGAAGIRMKMKTERDFDAPNPDETKEGAL